MSDSRHRFNQQKGLSRNKARPFTPFPSGLNSTNPFNPNEATRKRFNPVQKSGHFPTGRVLAPLFPSLMF